MFLSACLEGDIDTWIWEDGDGIEINERAPGTKRGLVVRALSNTIDLNNAGTFNVALNTNASRGRIEDADFAKESARLTKAQILQQSAMAMIAQAGKIQQNVLQLLQN